MFFERNRLSPNAKIGRNLCGYDADAFASATPQLRFAQLRSKTIYHCK